MLEASRKASEFLLEAHRVGLLEAQVTNYFVKQADELRAAIIEESQLVKNRGLSRLIANLNRQNWSSERNSVNCFWKVSLFYNSKKYLGLADP